MPRLLIALFQRQQKQGDVRYDFTLNEISVEVGGRHILRLSSEFLRRDFSSGVHALMSYINITIGKVELGEIHDNLTGSGVLGVFSGCLSRHSKDLTNFRKA